MSIRGEAQMTVSILPIEAGHIDSLHAVLDAVARERKYLAMLQAPPHDATRAYVLGNLEKGNPHVVAVDCDRVVGWCDISRKQRETYAHVGVLGIGLAADYRGVGLGRRLVAAALRSAQTKGITRVELAVYATNARAIALYEKMGFEREGCMRNYVFIDGRHCDAYLMAIPDLSQHTVPATA